jgi:hypothetical protein
MFSVCAQLPGAPLLHKYIFYIPADSRYLGQTNQHPVNTVTKTYRATGGPFLYSNHYLTSDHQEMMYETMAELDNDPVGPLIRESTSYWRFDLSNVGHFVVVTKMTSEKQQKEFAATDCQPKAVWNPVQMKI